VARRFEQRIVLVTGASRGIGAATAEAFAAEGAHVILAGRTQGGLEETEERIHAAGGAATIAPLDVTHGDLVDHLGQIIAERWGRLDILVLNAAMLGALTPLPHMDPVDFDRIVATNLTANFRLLRIMDPLLRASDSGRVIALTSSVAVTPRAYWGPYAASKAALDVLVASYADEVADVSPVRCLIVDPGRTRTRMRASAFPGEVVDSLPPPSLKALQIVDLAAKTAIEQARFVLD
jgi:NAD(P)-dependent dehydrogenase (short-subunit alcohol dehydrogenase family)